jgi:hypothetical protein
MSCAARPDAKRIAAAFKGAAPDGMDIVACALPDGQTSLVVLREYFLAESTLLYRLGFGTTAKDRRFDLFERMAGSFEISAE